MEANLVVLKAEGWLDSAARAERMRLEVKAVKVSVDLVVKAAKDLEVKATLAKELKADSVEVSSIAVVLVHPVALQTSREAASLVPEHSVEEPEVSLVALPLEELVIPLVLVLPMSATLADPMLPFLRPRFLAVKDFATAVLNKRLVELLLVV